MSINQRYKFSLSLALTALAALIMTPSLALSQSQIEIIRNNANLRQGPGQNYGTEGTAIQGTTATQKARQGSWTQIEIAGEDLWIHNSLIRTKPSAAPAVAKPRAANNDIEGEDETLYQMDPSLTDKKHQKLEATNCSDCMRPDPLAITNHDNPLVALNKSLAQVGRTISRGNDKLNYANYKANYENDPRTQCLERHMRGGRFDAGVGYCYRAVKWGMQDSKNVSRYLPDVAASKAITDLKQDGYENLLDRFPGVVNPANAPVGSVLVFRGPWAPLQANDPRIQSTRTCPRNRGAWREGCLIQDNGQYFLYKNWVTLPNGRRKQCAGAGNLYGHIEVKTQTGFSSFYETPGPITTTRIGRDGCRVLTAIMTDPKIGSGENVPDSFRCPAKKQHGPLRRSKRLRLA